MRISAPKSWLATSLAIGMVALAVIAWWAACRDFSHRKAVHGGVPPIPDVALARRAASAVCVSVDTPEAASAAGEQFSAGLRQSLNNLPLADRLDRARGEEFAALAEERFGMFLQPDYDEYSAHLKRLADADPRRLRSGKPAITREQFDRFTSSSKDRNIAPGDVDVIVRYQGGRSRETQHHGQDVRVTDGKKQYSDAGPAPLSPSLGADVYEARLPIEFPDASTGEMRRGFVGFALVWIPAEGRWLPWQTVLLDPTPTGAVSFPPPL